MGEGSGVFISLRGGLVEGGDRILHQLHLRKGQQKCQRRFSSLIPVDPVHVQRVPAAPCIGRVKLQTEIIPAQEPVKRALGVLIPGGVRGGTVGFQTR